MGSYTQFTYINRVSVLLAPFRMLNSLLINTRLFLLFFLSRNSDLKYPLAQIERNKRHRQELHHGVDESYVLFRLQIGVV